MGMNYTNTTYKNNNSSSTYKPSITSSKPLGMNHTAPRKKTQRNLLKRDIYNKTLKEIYKVNEVK